MALTMDDGVITVDNDDDDPVAVAARLRHLEDQIAGMPAEAVDAMGIDIGSVQSWLTGVLAKVTARATRLQQQGQRADPKRTRPGPVWVTGRRPRRSGGATRCRRCPKPSAPWNRVTSGSVMLMG